MSSSEKHVCEAHRQERQVWTITAKQTNCGNPDTWKRATPVNKEFKLNKAGEEIQNQIKIDFHLWGLSYTS